MFKVGQTVWCVLLGKGRVSSITDAPDAPDYHVVVIFESGKETRYTSEGKYYPDSVNRILFFSEPKVKGLTEPPFESKLVGKKVYCESTVTKEKFSGIVISEDEKILSLRIDGTRYNLIKINIRTYLLDEPYQYT